MSIKTWNCPGCHQSFIVDGESERDVCPWCNATVEQKGDDLQVVAEAPKQPEPASAGEPHAAASPTGPQSWWPFEYSS